LGSPVQRRTTQRPSIAPIPFGLGIQPSAPVQGEDPFIVHQQPVSPPGGGQVMSVDEIRAALAAIRDPGPTRQRRRQLAVGSTATAGPSNQVVAPNSGVAAPVQQVPADINLAALHAAAAALPPHRGSRRQRQAGQLQRRHQELEQQQQQVQNPPAMLPVAPPMPPVAPPMPPAVPVARQPFDKTKIKPHDMGRMNVICSKCGALHWDEEKLSKSTKNEPKFGTCCFSGKIQLPLLHPLPQEIYDLYEGDDHLAKEFIKNIRRYNATLAMTSVGRDVGEKLNVIENINTGNAPWIYKIQGQLCHVSGSLLPVAENDAKFSQLYIYDPEEAFRRRTQQSVNQGLNHDVLRTLQDMLYRTHSSVNLYKQAFELTKDLPAEQNIDIALRFDKDCDRRRYNLPTAANTEIAVVIPGEGGNPNEYRDIILRRKGGGLRRISEMHPAYHALHFVLLFPTGQLGWHERLEFRLDEPENAPHEQDQEGGLEGEAVVTAKRTRKFMSQMEFFKYRLHPRQNESSHIFKAGRLFQEFIVDAWASAEQSRLNWIRTHQQEIRSDVYAGLVDAVANDANVDLHQLGTRTILPSGFSGSVRNMIQNYQDAMAINRHFKGADLFLTATANPKWKEIQSELLQGQQASDRPDLVTRVFHAKIKKLIDLIFKEKIFGNAVARVYTIEFQKRSLPHMHIVIFG
jgi:Helitron helicase-like domain at N-terminus